MINPSTQKSSGTAWRIGLNSSNLRKLAQPKSFRLEHTITICFSHLTSEEVRLNVAPTCKWFTVSSESNYLWAIFLQRDFPETTRASVLGNKVLYHTLSTKQLTELHYGDSYNHRILYMKPSVTLAELLTGSVSLSNSIYCRMALLYGSVYHSFYTYDGKGKVIKNAKASNIEETKLHFITRLKEILTDKSSVRRKFGTFPMVSVGITCDYDANDENKAFLMISHFIASSGFSVAGRFNSPSFYEKTLTPYGILGLFVDNCPVILRMEYFSKRGKKKETDENPYSIQPSKPSVWIHLIDANSPDNTMEDTKDNILQEKELDSNKKDLPLVLVAVEGLCDWKSDSDSDCDPFSDMLMLDSAHPWKDWVSNHHAWKNEAATTMYTTSDAVKNENELLISSLFTFQLNALKNDDDVHCHHLCELSLSSAQYNLTNSLIYIFKLGLKYKESGNGKSSEYDIFNRFTDLISLDCERNCGRPSKGTGTGIVRKSSSGGSGGGTLKSAGLPKGRTSVSSDSSSCSLM